MRLYNRVLIGLGWIVVLITTINAIRFGYDNYPKRIAGLLALSVVTIAFFKSYRYTASLIIIILGLLSFNLITMHQSNVITFDANTNTTWSLFSDSNMRIWGFNFAVSHHPIYIILLITTTYIHRIEFWRFIQNVRKEV